MSFSWIDFSQEMFGLKTFIHCHFTELESWFVASNRPYCESPRVNPGSKLRFFHGCTLHQARGILRDGFTVGKHRLPSKDHPAGIYGTDHPGHALSRAHLDRGWSKCPEEEKSVLGGWDVPVAIEWLFRSDMVEHAGSLKTGQKYVLLYPYKSQVRVEDLDRDGHGTRIWIHVGQYSHFLELPSAWPRLLDGSCVVCRAPRYRPSVLYRCGDASPMTCARICAHELAAQHGWTRAKKTHQWICPSCTYHNATSMPFTEKYVQG